MGVKTVLLRGIFAGILMMPVFGGALELSPDFIQVRGLPRAGLAASLTVTNDSQEPVDVRLEVRGAALEEGRPWIWVSPEKLRIGSGSSRKAKLKMVVPRGATGERSAQVWARTKGQGPSELRSIRKVRLLIAGTEIYSLKIEGVGVSTVGDRVALKVDYLNEGNVSVRPVFGAELIREEGRIVSAYQEGSSGLVAPGARAEAHVVVPLNGARWDGKGTVFAEFIEFAGATRRVEKRVGD